jgi:hypothetical protein
MPPFGPDELSLGSLAAGVGLLVFTLLAVLSLVWLASKESGKKGGRLGAARRTSRRKK